MFVFVGPCRAQTTQGFGAPASTTPDPPSNCQMTLHHQPIPNGTGFVFFPGLFVFVVPGLFFVFSGPVFVFSWLVFCLFSWLVFVVVLRLGGLRLALKTPWN